jgi:Domain of unknown function (DUF4136)
MNTIRIGGGLIATLFALLLPVTGSGSVGVEYDKQADFSRYRTYAWTDGAVAPNERMQLRLQQAIERELDSQGLRKVDGTADLYILTHTATGTDTVINVDELGYSGYYWRQWAGEYPPTTSRYYVPVGTVMVEIFDKDSKERVWLGFAIEYFRGTPQKLDQLLDKVARKMFRYFPAR